MFREGENVVFIGNDSHIVDSKIYEEYKLSYGEVCEIYYCYNFGRKTCHLKSEFSHEYQQSAFITLKEYRKQKLDRICSKKEKK